MDAKESSTVFELKHIVQGLLKRPLAEQRLAVQGRPASGRQKDIGRVWLHQPDSMASGPSHFRADEAFEALHMQPFSSPPELLEVMKPQD